MPESHDMDIRDGMFETVDLFLTDRPYSVQSIAGKAKSEHNVLTREGIRDLDNFCSKVMSPGAYGHIFCDWLQFKGWFKMLLTQMKTCQLTDR